MSLFSSAAQPLPISPYVRYWLWCLAALVLAMVVVGGATRLTESGLSITEWKPVMGVLPPLSQGEWQEAFEKYKLIPQYAQLFPDMDLGRFQFIYYWEWSHRLLGRLIGFALFLPLCVFWLRGMLTPKLKLQLLGLLVLGGVQGFVGWWMVASGLIDRVEVAPERLATHLFLASLTFALLVAMAVSLSSRDDIAVRPSQRWLALVIIVSVVVQIVLGALVAGARAGWVYNTWPLMDGAFIPPFEHLLRLEPFWRNFFENVTTIQFIHRMMAYGVAGLIFAQGWLMLRSVSPKSSRRRAVHLCALVSVQIIIGIGTLLHHVPLGAGLAHQFMAMVVLAFAVDHFMRLRVTTL